MRDRFPQLGALFLAGEPPRRTVETIARRTELVTDDKALAAIDATITAAAAHWGSLSQYKLELAIGAAIQRHDPGAVRRARDAARGRDFTVGDPNDATGTTSIWGRLSTPDAALLRQAVAALANSVCDHDPRTRAQRRADALGALAARATRLPCRCGNATCPAGATAMTRLPPASSSTSSLTRMPTAPPLIPNTTAGSILTPTHPRPNRNPSLTPRSPVTPLQPKMSFDSRAAWTT